MPGIVVSLDSRMKLFLVNSPSLGKFAHLSLFLLSGVKIPS